MTDKPNIDNQFAELLGWKRLGDCLWEAGPNDLRYSGPPANKPKEPHRAWRPTANMNDAMEVWRLMAQRFNGESLYVAMEDTGAGGFEVGLRYIDRDDSAQWHAGPFKHEQPAMAICTAADQLLGKHDKGA